MSTAPHAANDCASEPIRVPGAIQPHGWLLSVDAADAAVAAWSDNWTECWAMPPPRGWPPSPHRCSARWPRW